MIPQVRAGRCFEQFGWQTIVFLYVLVRFEMISTCARGGRARVARVALFDNDCASGKRANVVE